MRGTGKMGSLGQGEYYGGDTYSTTTGTDIMGDGWVEPERDNWDRETQGLPAPEPRDNWDAATQGVPAHVPTPPIPSANVSPYDLQKGVIYAGQLYKYVAQRDSAGRTVYVPQRAQPGVTGMLSRIPPYAWLAAGLILFGLVTKK